MTKDYYASLGVPREAAVAAIKARFRELAMRDHPDKNPGNRAAEARFKEYAEAWSVLGDEKKRAEYDRKLSNGRDWTARDLGVNNMSWDEVFNVINDMFGKPVNFGGRVRAQRGEDIHVPLTLTFIEACRGTTKEIRIRREVGARIEDEVLRVLIPAGSSSGVTCRVPGKGGVGVFGGPSGNVYVDLTVAPDNRFIRDGLDIHVTTEVSFPALVFGGETFVETLDGPRGVRIPAHHDPYEPIRMRRQGIPSLNSRDVGDLLVHIKVEVPRRISTNAAAALRQYADLSNDQSVR